MSRYFAFFLPAIVLYTTFLFWSKNAGDLIFVYATLAFIFVVIPLLDLFAVRTRLFTSAKDSAPLSELVIVLLSLPLQLLNIFFFAWYLTNHDLLAYQVVLLVLTAGIFSALYAQNPAHELIHHGSRFERVIGLSLFSTSCYTGAKLAHVHSHHLLVATDQDPTSARFNQSLYEYLPGAIAVNLFGWWGPKHKTGTFSLLRRKILLENLLGYGLSVVWMLAIFMQFGVFAWGVFLIQSFIGILVLEMMNYIGHYGLERHTDSNGRLENVTERHAWDCDLPFSNLVLISVQKHADHHINPNKAYGELRCVENSPRLPISYPLLFLLSLVPPWWRAVIHPCLRRFRSGTDSSYRTNAL